MIVELCEHGEANPHIFGELMSDPTPYEECPGGRVVEEAIIIKLDKNGYAPEWAADLYIKAREGSWGGVAFFDALASAQESK